MDFLDAEKDTYRDDGSTASTAVLVGNHLYVANVGDSRTVTSKCGKGMFLLISITIAGKLSENLYSILICWMKISAKEVKFFLFLLGIFFIVLEEGGES